MTHLEHLENVLAEIDFKYREKINLRDAYLCARRALLDRIKAAIKEKEALCT